ncbi:MAG: hypothetical protein ACE1ZH_04510 [Gammaproteobacteria bacterium]
MSGTKTGSLVCATLINHEAVRVFPSIYLGIRYRDALFLRAFFLGMQKEGTRHKGETNIEKLLNAKEQ